MGNITPYFRRKTILIVIISCGLLKQSIEGCLLFRAAWPRVETVEILTADLGASVP